MDAKQQSDKKVKHIACQNWPKSGCYYLSEEKREKKDEKGRLRHWKSCKSGVYYYDMFAVSAVNSIPF